MKIDYEWISNITADMMDAYSNYQRVTNKTNEDKNYVTNIIHTLSEKDSALWAIHAVTNLPYDVLYNFVRIQRAYERKNKYEKCLFMSGDNDRRAELINSLWKNSKWYLPE